MVVAGAVLSLTTVTGLLVRALAVQEWNFATTV